MSLNTAKFVFVHEVEESRFELSYLACCGGHTHGFLTTPKQNVILVLGNDCVIHGSVRLVCLQMLKIHRIVEFGGEIRRSCNEECLVAIKAHSIDLLFVRLNLVLDVACLWVV
jgi:hypothetical protein